MMEPPATKRMRFACPPKYWSAFPEQDISSKIRLLTYPKKPKLITSERNIKVFVGFLNEYDKIYFDKRNLSERYLKHMINTLKNSLQCDRFNPNQINWTKIFNRYKNELDEKNRQNTDVRTSFKMNNKFLVCSYFTFGQMTVPPGKSHIYQLSKVPMLLFHHDPQKSRRKNVIVMDKHFPINEYIFYDRLILLPNRNYKILENTTYFILTVQKTFFALDVVDEPFDEIPFAWENPIANPIRKLPTDDDYYSAKTPYVEQEDQYTEIFEHLETPPMEEQQQQQMFYIIPNPPPPIFEKNIIICPPNFVERYQKLFQFKIYEKPAINFSENLFENSIDNPLLLDLSTKAIVENLQSTHCGQITENGLVNNNNIRETTMENAMQEEPLKNLNITGQMMEEEPLKILNITGQMMEEEPSSNLNNNTMEEPSSNLNNTEQMIEEPLNSLNNTEQMMEEPLNNLNNSGQMMEEPLNSLNNSGQMMEEPLNNLKGNTIGDPLQNIIDITLKDYIDFGDIDDSEQVNDDGLNQQILFSDFFP